jgi:hypothetical protein
MPQVRRFFGFRPRTHVGRILAGRLDLRIESSTQSDLTDEQWQIVRKFLPQPSRRGGPQTICRRAVLDAIIYAVRSGRP